MIEALHKMEGRSFYANYFSDLTNSNLLSNIDIYGSWPSKNFPRKSDGR